MKPWNNLPSELEYHKYLTKAGWHCVAAFSLTNITSLAFLTHPKALAYLWAHALLPVFEMIMPSLPSDHDLHGSISGRLFLMRLYQIRHSLLFYYPPFIRSFIRSFNCYFIKCLCARYCLKCHSFLIIAFITIVYILYLIPASQLELKCLKSKNHICLVHHCVLSDM